eukprot:TRINITY_DN698_c0_g2_i2.p1 TRINITY_DN698_c0_g2~~TRINITY_DN698_c0_g2_i2.p1  ORF type:complete len:267 (+),score=91.18 TRINITY_DN698_c0_g2_i2:48-803(+)
MCIRDRYMGYCYCQQMAQTQDSGYAVKIAMLGESGVGKTCIIDRFVNDAFNEFTDPTKGASFKAKTLKSEKGTIEIKLMLWDTAGQEIYRSLAPFYYKDADVALLVYDITNEKSFEALQYWANEVKNNGKTGCLLTVVGNKCDNIDGEKVTPDIAKEFSKQVSGSFFLTSAKENTNIKELFVDLAMRKFPQFRADFGFEEQKPTINAEIAPPPAQSESKPEQSKGPNTFKLAPTQKTDVVKDKKKKKCCQN